MVVRLRLDVDGEELTEKETALYDRQIRVWGADAQRRLSKSRVFVYGMKGTVAEFCKNIVLAGVGSLTVMDDSVVNEEVLSANFLIPRDEGLCTGKSLAEICCDSLKEFNPMVYVSVEKGDLASFDFGFFDKFDVVVVSGCSLANKKLINEKCRKSSKRVAFYTLDCRFSCGEIFVDLQNYKYTKKRFEETAECDLRYLSFQEAIAVPWRVLPRKTSKLYFAMRGLVISSNTTYFQGLGSYMNHQEILVATQYYFPSLAVIERFEEAEGRWPGEIAADDLPAILKLKKEICEAQSLDESHIPNALLQRLVMAGSSEFPPVCAVIGGILGQEVIKAISGKGDPLKNFFFFDVVDGKGLIEDI